jgi:glycerol-3-phosphate O-acyltransferase / dihydroxyacetone phosphate acyltransferase
MRRLSRILVRVFFRRIEVEGLGEFPVDGPAVLVANHINGLVDALLLMATLPRFPRFLGKSTLFRIPPLWPFLKLAGVVPVYRATDGEPTARNDDAFRTCRRLLARRALVALFPEGISHDESMLQPLKTGAARIALGAAADEHLAGVVIVAVGLSYDAKARFRSRVLVRVGRPEGADDWTEAYRRQPRQAVRDLTRETADRLTAVSPTYRSWVQATELALVADIVDRPLGGRGRADVELGRREQTAQRLADAEASDRYPDRLVALRRAWAEYGRDLALLGLSDSQLVEDGRPGRRRLALAWSVVRVAAALPAAAVGALLHAVPYKVMKRVGAVPANESIRATVKLLGCFFLFTLVYVVVGVLVGDAFGPWAGLAAAVVSPVCGYATVRLVERLQRIGGLVAGARILRQRRAVLATVLAHRTAVVEAAHAILAPDTTDSPDLTHRTLG